MLVSLNQPIINRTIPFGKTQSENKPTQKEKSKPNLKPLLYIGASVIPIAVGVLGVKSGLKNLKYPVKKICAELPTLASLLPEEKNVIQKMVQEGFDSNLTEIFVKVKNIENKEDFAKEAYNLLLDNTGYKAKPALIIEQTAPCKDDLGGWVGPSFLIHIYKDTTLTNSKAEIFDTLAHELEHFQQDALVLRTENLGSNALIDAYVKRMVKFEQKDSQKCLTRYNKNPKDLTTQDVYKYYNYAKDEESFKKYQEQLIKDKGIIKLDSEEGILAQEYLNSNINYVKADPKDPESVQDEQREKYYSNLLEKKAFAAGHKIRDLYEKFIIKLAELKLNKEN